MKIKINIRLTAIIALTAIFLLFIGYKYYEWSTLQYLNSLYNQVLVQEMSLIQDENTNYLTYYRLFQKVFSKDASTDSLINSYSELTGDLQIYIASQEAYSTAINQNIATFSNINVAFLFGQRGNFAKDLVSKQVSWYEDESENNNISDSSLWLTLNLLRAIRDMNLVNNFNKNTSSDYKLLIPKYWTDLSPLQIYTNPDFSFEHEDIIKKYYPDGYNLLENYKTYFSDFYSTIQDADNGDYESVSYKLPTLQQTGSSLNVNFSDLYNNTKDKQNSLSQDTIKIIADLSNEIKDFNTQKLYKYPLLPNINKNWKVDLALCNIYSAKANLYQSITSNYIKSSDSASLLNELNTVAPYTQFVDSKFDKSTMKIKNNDKELTFICIDKTNNTSYQVTTLK